MGDVGCAALFEALQQNQSLQELNLSANGVGNGGCATFGVVARVDPSCPHPCLCFHGFPPTTTTLSVRLSVRSESGMSACHAQAEFNRTLRFLFLACNTIGNQGAKLLMLPHNGLHEGAPSVAA